MTEFFFLIIIAALMSMMLFLIVRNIRSGALTETVNRIAPAMFFVTMILMILQCAAGGNVTMRVSVDLSVSVMPFMFLMSNVLHLDFARKFYRILLLYQCAAILCMSFFLIDVHDAVPDNLYRYLSMLILLSYISMMLLSVFKKVYDIKSIMKSASVPISLGLYIDIAYSVIYLTAFVILQISLWFPGRWGFLLQCLVIIVYTGMLAAFTVRLTCRSYFVILQKHERIIFESVRISHVETTNGVKDESYRELYDRIIDYFEKDKPFLDNQLTINDVAKVVFSNKVYISRAINQYTGRNFCQFVNYYRIRYSLETFRANPDMRITTMAQISGFNSVVSYNMAFHLFMNENPSDWCRKERYKIGKKKK